MKTIKLFAILMTLAFISGRSSASVVAVAKNTPPDSVVRNLYKQHQKRSPFFQTRSRALVDQFFDKSLADLIWKDAVNSKGEVGALGADPLYNAQDTDITRFVIHKPVYRSGQADVLVSFENFRQRRQITYQLVARGSGWRIANIKYGDGTDLVGMLQNNSPAPGYNTNVKVYLVAVGDNGRSGKKIGCEDSLVPVTRALPTTTAVLKAALEELLSVRSESTDPPGLQNFWKGRNLKLQSVSIQRGTATIHISGEVFVAGICDEPRIIGQIEETARQFPTVKRVKVFIGRRTLADAIR